MRNLLLACVVIAFLPLGACATATVKRPNIIVVLADDLGYGELGCYGQAKIRTPRLDQLAAEGIRCTQAYSGSCVCAPSRCTMLTGLHTGHAPVRDNREITPEGQEPLPAGTVTLATLLKELGYATMATGKWGLGAPESTGAPWKQGFDRFYGYNCQRHAHDHTPTWLYSDAVREDLPPGTYAPDRFREEALAFMREHKDGPFFIAYTTTIPHVALDVPEDSLREYVGVLEDQPYDGKEGYTPHSTPHAAYAAMVTRLDRDVGDLLDELDRLVLRENTIVVFTSDNGPTYAGGADNAFFDSTAGLRSHKGQLFEGGIRVPMIVRWPDQVPVGESRHQPMALWDLMPTLAHAAGCAVPEGLDGIDLAPIWANNAAPPERILYWEYSSEGASQAVRVGDWKAIRQGLRQTPDAPIQLYDLANDPGETRDVASEHPEVVARCRVALRTRCPASLETWESPFAMGP